MNKKELLVPAGSMECLKQAIHNGADAVYAGCKNFGARKFAANFTNDEIIIAIKLCHLYGVKIYATMNTLIKDNEVDDFLSQIEFLYENGIDAVIVQDFGMICLIRQKYPNLEIHASTQANTSSKETAELFYKLGVKRVVFSREMSIDEISQIDVSIEKEAFIHGALCISYSGCCLMSSMLGTRSGNRGECAGSCRLPYTLERNGKTLSTSKYLLSTKELNTSAEIKKLLQSDIISFKLEGRMKSPEYVGFITSFYRKLIDTNGEIDLKDYTDQLKTIFNREFTKGHLFNCTDIELMNTKTPNHIGLEIGKVISVTADKIKIKLSRPLNQQDGIRFLNSGKGLIANYIYDEKGKMISSANDICYIDNKVGLTTNDIVHKTLDYNLMTELKSYDLKKIPVTITAKCHVNSPLQIEISDGYNTVTKLGCIVQKSVTISITEERIKQQLSKLGQTPFISTKITVESDDEIFISIKEINELRRALANQLIEIRENAKKEVLINTVKFTPPSQYESSNLSVTVHDENQLQKCLSMKVKRIYVESELLYEKYSNYDSTYYKLPRCRRNPSKFVKTKTITNDYYDFKIAETIGDYGLNVYNIYTVYYLNKLGLKLTNLSVELTEAEINNLLSNYKNKFNCTPNLEVMIYGRVENMIIKGNIIQIKENENYSLVDIKNRKFPTFYDGENTHILNYTKTILQPSIINQEVKKRLDFYDESPEEIQNILSKYLN